MTGSGLERNTTVAMNQPPLNWTECCTPLTTVGVHDAWEGVRVNDGSREVDGGVVGEIVSQPAQ